MHSIFGRPALAFDDLGRPLPTGQETPVPMLGQFVQVYMDDIGKAASEQIEETWRK